MIRLKVPDGRPPWAIDAFTTTGGVGSFGTSSQMLFDMWEGNEKFRQQVLDELIKDCIHVEVAGIASATLAVNIVHIILYTICGEHLQRGNFSLIARCKS